MEAATENKRRGRPEKFDSCIYLLQPDEERRTAQNHVYVGVALRIIDTEQRNFFATSKGKVRRATILEKIGRALDAGIITEEEARGFIEAAISAYENGVTVKELSRRLTIAIDGMR